MRPSCCLLNPTSIRLRLRVYPFLGAKFPGWQTHCQVASTQGRFTSNLTRTPVSLCRLLIPFMPAKEPLLLNDCASLDVGREAE